MGKITKWIFDVFKANVNISILYFIYAFVQPGKQ